MNMHKNARLTFVRRIELVHAVIQEKYEVNAVAVRFGVSQATARKWAGRYLSLGEAGLIDRSSRPWKCPRAIAPSTVLAIVELRKKRLTMARIAQALRVSKSTVSRMLARAGLSRLSALDPVVPIVRYEHAAPGDLLHLDIKTLGRIEAVGHRITGNPRGHTRGAGFESLFVAIDDHSRIGFTAMQSSEGKLCAIAFLKDAVRTFARLGIAVRRILTDNGPAFVPGTSRVPAKVWVCVIAPRNPTVRRPTAKPNALSVRRCANGLTALSITTPIREPPCLIAGCITTTGTARIKA